MSSGGFDPLGTTNLFPSLSEPGHSFPFVAGFSGERANDHPERYAYYLLKFYVTEFLKYEN